MCLFAQQGKASKFCLLPTTDQKVRGFESLRARKRKSRSGPCFTPVGLGLTSFGARCLTGFSHLVERVELAEGVGPEARSSAWSACTYWRIVNEAS